VVQAATTIAVMAAAIWVLRALLLAIGPPPYNPLITENLWAVALLALLLLEARKESKCPQSSPKSCSSA